MQQNSELIIWAKELLKKHGKWKWHVVDTAISDFIENILLPKLEGCKTSPNIRRESRRKIKSSKVRRNAHA